MGSKFYFRSALPFSSFFETIFFSIWSLHENAYKLPSKEKGICDTKQVLKWASNCWK